MGKELLLQILANQCVLFSKIEKLSDKMENRLRVRSEGSIVDDLVNESQKFRKIIEENI